MIKIPYDIILQKIVEKSGLPAGEIEEKVKTKMELLSGLVSKEGAAHIVANELGVRLFDEESGRLKIKNLLPGMRNVEITGRVQDIFEAREFHTENRTGKVGGFLLGDETGIVRIVLWGSQTDKLKELEKEMVIKIQFGYVKENFGRREVHLRDNSNIIINPSDEVVGEVKKSSLARKSIAELQENDVDIELLGTIVQVFEPRFFEVCPHCSKRIKPREIGLVCDTHGEVKPAFSYVVSTYIDDGSANIRVTFFSSQLQIASGKTNNEIIETKDNPQKFEEIKKELMGKIIKIAGRMNKNIVQNRMEFIANRVYPNPDPKDEIGRLKKMLGRENEEIKADKADEAKESKVEDIEIKDDNTVQQNATIIEVIEPANISEQTKENPIEKNKVININ